MSVADITGREDSFTLDRHGFQLCQHKSELPEEGYEDDERIKGEYYPEMEKLLKDVLVLCH